MTHQLTKTMAELGLTVSAVFVPWSQSRNFDQKATPDKRSLNWRVTVQRNGRDVLTTDYQAGVGHCPSYKAGTRWTLDYSALIVFETENGRRARSAPWGTTPGKPILPNAEDVVASLALDAAAIDSATYETWASEFGYDPDSRKGEAIYRACLEHALKLRAALGDDGLAKLRDAAAEW